LECGLRIGELRSQRSFANVEIFGCRTELADRSVVARVRGLAERRTPGRVEHVAARVEHLVEAGLAGAHVERDRARSDGGGELLLRRAEGCDRAARYL